LPKFDGTIKIMCETIHVATWETKTVAAFAFLPFPWREQLNRTGSGLIWSVAPDPFRSVGSFFSPYSSRHNFFPPEIRTFSRWERKPRVLPRRSTPPASPRPRRGRSPSPQRSSSPGSSARSFLPYPQIKLRLHLLPSIFRVRSSFLSVGPVAELGLRSLGISRLLSWTCRGDFDSVD
jgi:hypothetical protein